jgi:hypothetical protein
MPRTEGQKLLKELRPRPANGKEWQQHPRRRDKTNLPFAFGRIEGFHPARFYG